MNKEILSIIKNIENILSGQPWFGRPVYDLLNEADKTKVYTKPYDKEHSLIELLYHMITWAEFTLSRLDTSLPVNLAASEEMDWREINPAVHDWQAGMDEFKKVHEQIIAILQTKEDSFLSGIADERKYNYRFLLNGLIQHNIYHAGQIAFINKLLS
jgi:uncharacterized damage-inducible protein DinB